MDTHLAHCLECSVISVRKEGNVLFHEALNIFLFTIIWHRTYGKGLFLLVTGRNFQIFLCRSFKVFIFISVTLTYNVISYFVYF